MELIDAIRQGNTIADSQEHKLGLICWRVDLGWYAVSIDEYSGNQLVDIICLGCGQHPLPVSDIGMEAWMSLVRSKAHEAGYSTT